jgi:iron complex transport system ATP-binding protein
MIEANHIGVRKSGRWILRKAGVKVRAGELVAIIGANGAGKSTLLKAVAGEIVPEEGSVSLNGQALTHWPAAGLAKLRGVLSQSVQLPFSMPVLDLVEMGRYPYQGQEASGRIRQIARRCLRQVGLSGYEARDICTLSGGEQQRAQLARVLAQVYREQPSEERFLLLDEPTASQDIAQKQQLLSLLRKLANLAGIGILTILHDLNLAMQYADRVVLLRGGHLLKSGTPGAVLTPELIAQGFGVKARVVQPPGEAHPHILTCPTAVDLFQNEETAIP